MVMHPHTWWSAVTMPVAPACLMCASGTGSAGPYLNMCTDANQGNTYRAACPTSAKSPPVPEAIIASALRHTSHKPTNRNQPLQCAKGEQLIFSPTKQPSTHGLSGRAPCSRVSKRTASAKRTPRKHTRNTRHRSAHARDTPREHAGEDNQQGYRDMVNQEGRKAGRQEGRKTLGER
jgi:hypothetical protein